MNIQTHEAQMILNKLNPKSTSQRYITIKLSEIKVKESILKAEREK